LVDRLAKEYVMMMKSVSFLAILFLTVLVFFAVAGCESKNNDESRGDTPKSITDVLEDQGFEVSSGYVKLWTIDDCDYTVGIMGVCYGNNPAAPYVIATLPAWPEEYVDPVVGSLWGPSQDGYHDVYRMDPREAILIYGQLPPPGAYFSEQTWLISRVGEHDKGSHTYKDINEYLPALAPMMFSEIPGHPERIQSMSSLSNIINNVLIEQQSGASFDQTRYIIVTPDEFMDTVIRKALAEISIKNEDVFTEQIPSDMNVGLDESADDFTTWIRYAHPDDGGEPGTPSDDWRKNLPLKVLRVRDPQLDREPQKYPPVVLEERTAVDERPLKKDLTDLLYAVSRKWGQPCSQTDCSDRAKTFIDLQTFPTYLVGPLCRVIGESCLLDTQDTIYQIYGPMPLDDGEIYAIAGTLGTETGNATYVGFGINQMPSVTGVANLSNEILRGTADGYEAEVANTDKFYLYYFSRDCSGLETLTGTKCFELDSLYPKGTQLLISLRDYVKPGTLRGPDSSQVLPPMMLQVEKP
jgi:hypothetical protein